MRFSLRGLFALTALSALSFLAMRTLGVEAGFVSLLLWMPTTAAVLIHASAPSRFHRNMALMLPVTLLCCLFLCGAYLVVQWKLESQDPQELFVRGFELFPLAFVLGGAYGLIVIVHYCFFLMRRHQLSNELRPLNGNDLAERF